MWKEPAKITTEENFNIPSCNEDIESILWFFDIYKDPQLRREVTREKLGFRMKEACDSFLEGCKLIIKQIDLLLSELEKRKI